MAVDLTTRIVAANVTIRYRATTPGGRFIEEAASVDMLDPAVRTTYQALFAALAASGYEQVRGSFDRLAQTSEDPAAGIPFTPPPPPVRPP